MCENGEKARKREIASSWSVITLALDGKGKVQDAVTVCVRLYRDHHESFRSLLSSRMMRTLHALSGFLGLPPCVCRHDTAKGSFSFFFFLFFYSYFFFGSKEGEDTLSAATGKNGTG